MAAAILQSTSSKTACNETNLLFDEVSQAAVVLEMLMANGKPTDVAAKAKEKVPHLVTEMAVPREDQILQAKGEAKADEKLPIPRFVEGLPLARKTRVYVPSSLAAIAGKATTANSTIRRSVSS